MQDDPSPSQAGWTPLRRHYVLFVLCLVGVFNFVDRQIVSILLQPIKEEFNASDTAMGLLTGLMFAGFYAAASIPLARLSDRFARRTVLAACLGFWSLMTSLGGVAQTFLQLAVSRIGVATAEAGAGPASHSMAADLYPMNFRGTAIAILSAAQSIGIGLGVFLGGWLLAHFTWRTSFLVVGLPGLLLAVVLMLTVKEPPRGLSDGKRDVAPAPKLGAALRRLWRMNTYRCLMLTAALCGLTGYGILGWGPTFLIRVHHMAPAQVGVWFGGATALSLMAGNLMGGVVSDFLGRRDLRAYLWVGGLGPVLSAPFVLLFVFSPTWQLAIVGLFCFQLILTTHIPTCYALAQTLAPLRMRATASVLMTLATSIVGTGLAPLLIGILNDVLTAHVGEMAVRYSLGVMSLGALIGGSCALLGARWVRRDYAATLQEEI